QMISKSSKGELEVLINKDQLEFIKKDLKEYFGSYLKSLSFVLFGLFLIFYDENLKNIALILVSIGFLRILFIK
ncbi:AarF/ABC1/UbiB kinase family protein, partial [Aliarcobacter butzleri]